ncbi:MAG: hypothetical protein EAZ07_00530 [Cytophagales bacterium]|nr:MAG: hypothetical protein EAZ07_00530 [Cytophagales bacterium]
MKHISLKIFLFLISYSILSSSMAQEINELDNNLVNTQETEITLGGGINYLTIKDNVVSKFVYNGLGGIFNIGISHRNEAIKYSFAFNYQAFRPKTQMFKGFEYQGLLDTANLVSVNGVKNNEIQSEILEFNTNFLFRVNKNTPSKFQIWAGMKLLTTGITKKFLIFDHQNLTEERWTSFHPEVNLEYHLNYKHRFYYNLDASLLGFFSRDYQFNQKPFYFDNSDYLVLSKDKGTYGLSKMMVMNSTLGYRFLITRFLAMNIQYQLIYNRIAVPLETRMVRQQLTTSFSFVF